MIKFRAWNQIDSEYINEINAVMSLDGSHIWWDINDSGEMNYDDDPGDYKLEQFTGLKDVNGKEIYIGDIVKYRNLDEKYQYLKIRWLQQDCMVDAGGYRIDIVARRCEVIGNVHTNPELLEEEQ